MEFDGHTDLVKAGPLGLLEEDTHSSSLTIMMNNLTRFLLEKISIDYRSIAPASTALEQELFGLTLPVSPEDLVTRVLATSAVSSIRCISCRSETQQPRSTFVNELKYPSQVSDSSPIPAM
jgi:PAB-dependent poly(A)-specific ribonuclease subunit 2